MCFQLACCPQVVQNKNVMQLELLMEKDQTLQLFIHSSEGFSFSQIY